MRINVTGYQGKRMLGAEGYVKAVDAETFDYAPSTATDQIGAPVRVVQKGSCVPYVIGVHIGRVTKDDGSVVGRAIRIIPDKLEMIRKWMDPSSS